MARPKKETCFERIQIYLIPELVANLRCNADKRNMKLSMYLRDTLESIYLNEKKGNNAHERL